jgi:type IV secretory pathway VirB3-like protein
MDLNKKEKLFLILGITITASTLMFLLANDWILGSVVVTGVFLVFILIARAKKEEKRKEETETLGVEAKAVVDSRIYERPSFFLGVPLIFIVFGGMGSKYESVFSIEYQGKTVIVLYHGLCLVSAEDQLLIRGKWYMGKKLGIQGNIIVADKVENQGSGLVFEKI